MTGSRNIFEERNFERLELLKRAKEKFRSAEAREPESFRKDLAVQLINYIQRERLTNTHHEQSKDVKSLSFLADLVEEFDRFSRAPEESFYLLAEFLSWLVSDVRETLRNKLQALELDSDRRHRLFPQLQEK